MGSPNKLLILEKCKKLLELYRLGKIKTLEVHEVHPDVDMASRINYLYFTLPPCLNFQRKSPAMWQSALQTYNDPETNYLFYPERVVETPYEQVMQDLVKHKLALLKNKHTQIWTKICATLHEYYQDDPRKLLNESQADVVKILKTLQADKKKFPHLNGPKMSNYWLYILSQYTNANLTNMSEVSIIPDTHVIQSSIKLGLIDSVLAPEKVSLLWKDLLDGSGIAPVQMHPVLWNWSRDNFKPEI